MGSGKASLKRFVLILKAVCSKGEKHNEEGVLKRRYDMSQCNGSKGIGGKMSQLASTRSLIMEQK